MSNEHTTEQEGGESAPVRRAEPVTPQAIEDERRAREQRAECRDRFRIGLETIGLIAVIFAGIFTFRQFVEMAKQSRAAVDAASAAIENNKIAEENLRISSRAYLTLTNETAVEQIKPGAPLKVKIVFKNVGHSPADEVETHVFRSGSRPLLDFAPFCPTARGRTFPISKSVVGPEQEIPIMPPFGRVSAADYEAILAEERTIYFWGYAFYRDIFHQRHVLAFCNFIEPVVMETFTTSMALSFCGGTDHNFTE
jgi:hypothetical protein